MKKTPDWDSLYDVASAQEGYFTTLQAGSTGHSRPSLSYHSKTGRIERVFHGIYRLRHYPPGEQEHLVPVWLRSNQEGVFSHQTALFLHQLSDVLPKHLHLTLPLNWKGRRLSFPQDPELHYEELSSSEIHWHGPVPVTSPSRTLEDCARAHIQPHLLQQALREGLQRGLFEKADVPRTLDYLEPFFHE